MTQNATKMRKSGFPFFAKLSPVPPNPPRADHQVAKRVRAKIVRIEVDGIVLID